MAVVPTTATRQVASAPSAPVLSVAPSRVRSIRDGPGLEETWEAAVAMLIDCDSCVMRDLACADCVVTVLLGPPPESGFDDEATRALGVLADSGLVPQLRMVTPLAGPDVAATG